MRLFLVPSVSEQKPNSATLNAETVALVFVSDEMMMVSVPRISKRLVIVVRQRGGGFNLDYFFGSDPVMLELRSTSLRALSWLSIFSPQRELADSLQRHCKEPPRHPDGSLQDG